MRHEHMLVDGVRLHWAELAGSPAATPIVLLHGMNDSYLSWRLVAPLLAGRHRVLMLDLPGCGLSDRPDASYALAWHADLVAKWLAKLGIERADVVGHSFGGGVAQMLLLHCLTRIRRVVLVAPGGFGRAVGFWLRVATALPRLVERCGQPFMRHATRWALRCAGARFTDEELKACGQLNAIPGTARAFARTVRDVITPRGQSRLFWERTHEIAQLPPIAVYWGDRDLIIPIAQGIAFAQALKGVVFRAFPGCGHYLHHERPLEFTRALLEFLDEPRNESVRVRVATLQVVSPTLLTTAWRLVRTAVEQLRRRWLRPSLPSR